MPDLTRTRRTKWGKDHLRFQDDKETLCGLTLGEFKPRGERLCVECRRVKEHRILREDTP